MWTLFWITVSIAIILVLMTLVAKFGGKGHLDVERSQNHYLDEVETRSRFPWA